MEIIWKSSKEADDGEDRANHTWKPGGIWECLPQGSPKSPEGKPPKNLPPHPPLHWVPRTNTFFFCRFQTFSKVERVCTWKLFPIPSSPLDRVPYTSGWPHTIMYWGDLLNSWSPFLTPKCWDGRRALTHMAPLSFLGVIPVTEVRADTMSCHLEYSSVYSFPRGTLSCLVTLWAGQGSHSFNS